MSCRHALQRTRLSHSAVMWTRQVNHQSKQAPPKPKSPPPAARGPPPYLPRPLGVSKPPQKLSSQAKKELSRTEEQKEAQRKVLMKEFKTSYFQDFRDIEQTGGKLWLAPQTVIRQDRSLYFPEVTGLSLASKEDKSTVDLLNGKVTLLAVTSTQISAEQVQSYIPPLLQDNAGESLFQLVQINLQENPLKSFLLSLFLSNLRRSVPQDQQDNYLFVTQNFELIREPLGMINKHVGYVFLIDWKSRIRWAAVGASQGDELESLRSCTSVLLERFKSGQEG